jgi:hypothetical protein
MKRIREKYQRTVKYWLIRYKQANERDRLFIGMGTLIVLIYAWWVMLVL